MAKSMPSALLFRLKKRPLTLSRFASGCVSFTVSFLLPSFANLREARTICSVRKRTRDCRVPYCESSRLRSFVYCQLIGIQHGAEDVAFQFYAPDGGREGKYGDAPSVDVLSIVDGINPEYGNLFPAPPALSTD